MKRSRRERNKPKPGDEQTSFDILYGKKGLVGLDDELPWSDNPVPLLEFNPPTKDDSMAVPKKDEEHFVTILPDHHLDFPELWLEIYVHDDDPGEQAAFARLFARAKCRRADSIEKADIVVFTGGPDVDPQLYAEKPHPTTRWDVERDNHDIDAYFQCIEAGVPMLGICRGAQFLHVMQDGKLWQHVDNHNGDHNLWLPKEKRLLECVSSVHHQMVRHKEGMEILATNNSALNHWANDRESLIEKRSDIEAFFYRDACIIGIQGHPEYSGYNAFAQWTMQLILDYVSLNPDLKVNAPKGGVMRIKPDLLEQRQPSLGLPASITDQGVTT
jgi:gamma-glutamyl-gamma-aminobutyrate hydrolase PuuD